MLYDELNQYSPYLSKEVLMAAANRTDVLPYNLVFVLCCNNPEITKHDDFLEFLRTKNDPFTEEQIASFKTITANLSTERASLENQISKHSHKMNKFGNMIISHYKQDTNATQYDSLRFFIRKMNNPTKYFELLPTFIQQQKFNRASNYLSNKEDSILSQSSPYYDSRVGCYNFYTSLLPHLAQEKTIYNIDESTKIQLETWANGKRHDACYRSRNILNWAYDKTYRTPFYLPVPKKSSSIEENITAIQEDVFTLKPNPANNWVEIAMINTERQTDETLKRELQLFDSQGKIVQQITWSSKQPSQVVNTSSLESGVYFVVLLENNKAMQTEKLVIKK